MKAGIKLQPPSKKLEITKFSWKVKFFMQTSTQNPTKPQTNFQHNTLTKKTE